jgi:predicted transcriptional regulator
MPTWQNFTEYQPKPLNKLSGETRNDFMFLLTIQEVKNLRSQFVTSSGWGGVRYAPMAFTEQGVAMLSSVLNSTRAIEVNIQIMRAFVKLREMIASHKDLSRRLDALEKKYDDNFKVVFEAIRALMAPQEKPKKKIGFGLREKQAGFFSLPTIPPMAGRQ